MRSNRRTGLLDAVVLCVAVLSSSTTASVERFLDPLVRDAIHADPAASRDFLATLTPEEGVRFLKTVTHDVRQPPVLRKPHVTINVEVVLHGFEGSNHWHGKASEAQLRKHIQALHLPSAIEDVVAGEELGVTASFAFNVRLGARHVTNELEGAIKVAVEAGTPLTSADAPIIQIPHTVVENVLERELAARRVFQRHYWIHVLSPRSPGVQYAYQFGADNASCASAMWAARSRFMWVDVQAGPVSFSNRDDGSGQGQTCFPPPDHSVLSQVTAFVASACRQALLPPLHHLVPEPHKNVHVQVITIYDMERPPTDAPEADYDLVRSELQAAMAANATVSLDHRAVALAHCDACVEALTSAMQTATRLQRSSDMDVVEHSFLDAASLRKTLAAARERIFTVAGVQREKRRSTASLRVVPAYVFRLSSREALLLDDGKQSVGFPGMAIAVATRSGDIPSRVECNGRPMLMRGHEVTRPLLDALLLAGWGVAPPLEGRCGAGAVTGGNVTRRLQELQDGAYNLASMHWTPVPSFVQMEAARRNMALSALHSAYVRVQELFDGLATLAQYSPRANAAVAASSWLQRLRSPGGVEDEVAAALEAGDISEQGLTPPRRLPIVRSSRPRHDAAALAEQRRRLQVFAALAWRLDGGKQTLERMHVLEYKLRVAGVAVGEQESAAAMWLLASMRHDVDAIKRFTDAAREQLRIGVDCPQTLGARVLSLSTRACALLAPSVIVLLCGLVPTKRKRKHKLYGRLR